MKIENLKTVESLEAFLQGNQQVAFTVLGSKTERYNFVRKTLIKFSYMTLPKKNKGTVIRYLLKLTEYSRQQLTRLIKQYTETGRINWTPCRSNGFSKKYTDQDIKLLAKTDEFHDTPCGHTLKKLCERAHDIFDDKAYQRLTKISVSHVYNLRDSERYKRQLGILVIPIIDSGFIRSLNHPSAKGFILSLWMIGFSKFTHYFSHRFSFQF